MDPEGYEEEIDLVEEIDLLTNEYVGEVDEVDEDLEDGNSKIYQRLSQYLLLTSFSLIILIILIIIKIKFN